MKTALIVIMLALLAGIGLFIAGIYLLAGLGWALMAASAGAFAVAALLKAGVTSG